MHGTRRQAVGTAGVRRIQVRSRRSPGEEPRRLCRIHRYKEECRPAVRTHLRHTQVRPLRGNQFRDGIPRGGAHRHAAGGRLEHLSAYLLHNQLLFYLIALELTITLLTHLLQLLWNMVEI